MAIGLHCPNGMLSMALSANPVPFIPNPKANPPATIQMTLQLISCRSLPVLTPVTAKKTIGIMATVFESIPVISLGINHKRMVRINVPDTTHILHPF